MGAVPVVDYDDLSAFSLSVFSHEGLNLGPRGQDRLLRQLIAVHGAEGRPDIPEALQQRAMQHEHQRRPG